MLDPRITKSIKQAFDKLVAEKSIRPQDELDRYFKTFREKFGPEKLLSIDGEALLERMHALGKDSLAYWLEFKNDDEFPSHLFGSIAGGSALKFGLFRRKETGEWVTGSSLRQKILSVDEAVEMARKHRDQLVAGAKYLADMPAQIDPADYERLQSHMDTHAADVSRLAWGHKYFHLLFPDWVDDFHGTTWQQYNLRKLLQPVPETDDRYTVAYWFVVFRRELEMPMNWFTFSLNTRNGPPRPYWRAGTSDGTKPRNRWDIMRDGNFVAVGWPALGNLSQYGEMADSDAIESLKQALTNQYPSTPQAVGRAARQVYRFATKVNVGDIVVAADGGTIVGIARVNGAYFHDDSSDFPNRLPVDWLQVEDWSLPQAEGLQTSLYEIRDATNIVEIERRILEASGTGPIAKARATAIEVSAGRAHQLKGLAGRIQSVLERKGQVILYGPPGTGKTHWAEKVARDLAALDSFGRPFSELDEKQRRSIRDGGDGVVPNVRLCCFHPAYGYEDFLEGFRPEQRDGRITFILKPGVFKSLCRDAAKEPNRKFYLIIDEINRGDIPRIFGELLTLVEKNKRGVTASLPLSGETFRVPPNVYLIGTMNTADRSIALLDAALRRRFGFIELMPDSTIFGSATVGGIPLGGWLDGLNRRICENIGKDARNLQVGHSYFLEAEKAITDFQRFARVVHDEVIPLLEEYCYEDHDLLHRILGNGLVDQTEQRVRHELFEPSNEQLLIDALLNPTPDLLTTAAAVTAEQGSEVTDNEEDEVGESTGADS